jgi:LysR family transcriptional regulator, transcriptional activator for bauABCD operon
MRAGQKFSLDLDWNLLKIFHSIVEANGVSSAANALWRKQSTISLALQRLERNVGKKLCRRGPAGFALTEEGRILFECISEVYAKVSRIPDSLDNASQELRGRLHLRTISNFVSTKFDKLLMSYTTRCPLVELHIEVAPWEAISLSVLRGEVDVGIAPVHVQYPELTYELLTRETHLVYCGKRHHLFGSTIADVGDLAQEPLVLTGADEPDSLTYYRLRHGLGKRIAATTPNLEEAKRLAILGLGICLLPDRMAAADVKKGLLWPLTSKALGSGCDVFAITNRHAPRRLVVDLFMEEVTGRATRKTEAVGRPDRIQRAGSGSLGPRDASQREVRPVAQCIK